VAKSLAEWMDTEVREVRDKPLNWLSQYYFFRDPSRAIFSDTSYFLAPADGVILYQEVVAPDECLLDIKGKPYSLRQAMRDETYDRKSLVIGIFMTFYDVHINRVPFPGRLSYRQLDSIGTFNRPMLDVERSIIEDLHISMVSADYLRHNQRMLNRIFSIELQETYYILQIADYDVDCITPFNTKQNQPVYQGERFSQIRFGSQVDLIIPLSARWDFETIHPVGYHVEAGIDKLVAIKAQDPQGSRLAAREVKEVSS
jgi:phosphatidylserine decarboxylase